MITQRSAQVDTGDLFDSGVHIERAVHIQTMLTIPCADMEEAIADGELDGAAKLLGWDPEVLVEAARNEELGWLLRDATGWIVEASAPQVGPWDEGHRSRAVYPGYRISRWFKADDYEAAVQQAIDWAESDPDELVRR